MQTNRTATSTLPALTPLACEPVYKTARFTAGPGGWVFQGFSGYLDGRLPTSEEDLLRLCATGEQPGEYVFVSYLSDREFDDLFAEDADGFFSLRDESVALVTKREISVPA